MSVLLGIALLPQIANCQTHKIKPTKQQRQAVGFWRVDPPQNGTVRWLVILVGDSPETMTVRWPTGIACQDDPAEIHGNKITIGGHFPAVLELNGSREATLTTGGSTLHLRKTKESTNFVCE
ncbi:MAG TPA: hypothetical protein VMP68_21560 [Candidatus Eisenbacteria bacterium]|nr:hypothetical protein [Candidatus Eisenbacteria bacterium]